MDGIVFVWEQGQKIDVGFYNDLSCVHTGVKRY